MRLKRSMRDLALVLGALFTATACWTDADCHERRLRCSDEASGGGSGMSGVSGSGGSGSPTANCAANEAPSTGCTPVDEHTVFVAPQGSDDGTGGKDAPFKSISKAIELATLQDKSVVVCSGAYVESVKIRAGVRVFGGVACPGAEAAWTHQPGTRAVVVAAAGYALDIRDVAGPVVLEDLEFRAVDAVPPGASSVAAVVSASADVTLRRVRLEAGKGANGAPGSVTPFNYPTRQQLDGNNAAGTSGGSAKICTCPGGYETTGGSGGDGPGAQGGGSGTPDHPGAGGEGGDETLACGAGGTGQNGAAGPLESAAPGAARLGVLSSAGWVPANGSDGSPGKPGQGGGGGASAATGGGGGGGCGACGGAGARAGQGGGASIALLSVRSQVQLEDAELVSADAGNGGSGAAGQPGQTEAGFGGVQGPGACAGGSGGPGAAGGASGGGAGGISAAIVYAERKPTRVRTTVELGSPGSKGLGGALGVNDGIDGVAEEEVVATEQ